MSQVLLGKLFQLQFLVVTVYFLVPSERGSDDFMQSRDTSPSLVGFLNSMHIFINSPFIKPLNVPFRWVISFYLGF